MTAAVGSAQLNTPDDFSREPYKFLDFFNEKDDRTFAGRERDINEVVAGITTDRAFVLYSRSGLGKTSLLLAGVFPELRKRGFQPIYCRVLESPLGDMREALKKALGADVPTDPTEAISVLSQLGGHPVLVLDQFEELFTRFARKPEKKRALVRWLKALLVSPDIDFHVLISLREDFLALLDEFGDEFSRLLRSNYRLRPLTAFGARQAIIRPLTEAGIRYEAKMVSRLVDILAGEDFDSLLLQLSCTGVYQQAVKRRERPIFLRETDLSVLGGIEGILGRYLDQQTSQFPSSKLLLIRNVLDALITTENTKRAATLEDIHKADFNATPEEIVDIIDFLKKSRLVREEMRREQLWYELMHERLVGPILSWFALDKDFAEFRYARDVIVNGARNARFAKGGGALLAGQTIEQVINPYRERLRLDPAQTEFVFRSAVYHTTKDVDFWIRAAGEERAGAILLELMSDSDATARCGAAAAAGKVVRKPEICERLAHMALTDPETEVRRAAGKALAVLGAVDDSSLYHQAVNLKDQRKPLIEALADAYECGQPVTGFGFRIRRRARKTARQRVLDMQRPLMRGKAKTGAFVGLAASLGWLPAIGVPIVAMAVWMNGPVAGGSARSENFAILFWVALACTILSTLFCWRSAVVAAENSALRRSASWFRHILQTRTIFVGFAVIAVIPMGMLVDKLQIATVPSVVLTVFLIVVLALAMQLVLAGLAQYNHSLLKHASRGISVAIWAILASLGLPFLVPLLTATIIVNLESTSQQASSVIGFTLVAAALIGVLSFALTLTLARLIPASTSQVATRRGWVLKGVALILAVGPLVWCALAFGVNFIPILAKRPQQSGQDKILNVHLRKSWPNSRYFRLRSDTPQWFYYPDIPTTTQAALSNGSLTQQLASRTSLFSDPIDFFILLPAGDTYAWVTSGTSWPQEQDTPDAQIKFTPVPPLNSAESLSLSNNWIYRQIRLRPKDGESKGQSNGDTNVWVSDQRLLLQKGSYNPGQLVEIVQLGVEDVDTQHTANKNSLLHLPRPPFTAYQAFQSAGPPQPGTYVPLLDSTKIRPGVLFQDNERLLAAPDQNGQVRFEFPSPVQASQNTPDSRQEAVILAALRLGSPFGPNVLSTTELGVNPSTGLSAGVNRGNPDVLEMQYFGPSWGQGDVDIYIKSYRESSYANSGSVPQDISGYDGLSLEMKSSRDSSLVGIGLGNFSNGSLAQGDNGPKVQWVTVTPQWKTYTFQLSSFNQDLESVASLTKFFFKGLNRQTVYARNIKFITQESPQQ